MANQPKDADEMYNRGAKLHQKGKDGEAEQWMRKAAAAGHTKAMSSLGFIASRQGKDGEAEQWMRKAAAAGDTAAMYNLGVRMHNQGKDGEAEQWMRKAADAGDVNAMSRLADLLRKQGKDGEAGLWMRKAAAGQRQGPGYFHREWGWRWSRSGGNQNIAEMGEEGAALAEQINRERDMRPGPG